MRRDRPGFASRWWLGVCQRNGNDWAQRIIWVLERLDSSNASSLDRWGSLCAVVPEDDPVARFAMARQLIPSIFDPVVPSSENKRKRAATPPQTKKILKRMSVVMALFLVVFAVTFYVYFKHLESRLPDNLTADERKKALADAATKDSATANKMLEDLSQLGLYILAGFGLLLLIGALCFFAWMWIGSGRAVKQASRREAP